MLDFTLADYLPDIYWRWDSTKNAGSKVMTDHRVCRGSGPTWALGPEEAPRFLCHIRRHQCYGPITSIWWDTMTNRKPRFVSSKESAYIRGNRANVVQIRLCLLCSLWLSRGICRGAIFHSILMDSTDGVKNHMWIAPYKWYMVGYRLCVDPQELHVIPPQDTVWFSFPNVLTKMFLWKFF